MHFFFTIKNNQIKIKFLPNSVYNLFVLYENVTNNSANVLPSLADHSTDILFTLRRQNQML